MNGLRRPGALIRIDLSSISPLLVAGLIAVVGLPLVVAPAHAAGLVVGVR